MVTTFISSQFFPEEQKEPIFLTSPSRKAQGMECSGQPASLALLFRELEQPDLQPCYIAVRRGRKGCWLDRLPHVCGFRGGVPFLAPFYEIKPKVMNRRLISGVFGKNYVCYLNSKLAFTDSVFSYLNKRM